MFKHVSKALSLFGPFLGLVFVYCLFLLITGAMSTEEYNTLDRFRSLYNTKMILTQTVIVGIGSLGMTLIIISGGIDLSVGSIVALVTVVTATILKYGIPDDIATDATSVGIWLPLLAAVAGVAAGALCGFINGCITSFLRIVPFIATLGMMQIARGLAKGLGRSTTVEIRQVDADAIWLNHLMRVPGLKDYHTVPGDGALAQIQAAASNIGPWLFNVFVANAWGVWLMIALLATMYVVLRYTVFGRHVFAIGSNEATARLCGVNVTMSRVWIFTLCGALTGVAGVMQFSRLTLGSPTAGIAMELDIIAAVVIGGGSLSGGQGSVIGSLVGALIIVVLRNGCTMVGAPNFVQNIIIGVIIIAAVGVDRLKRRGEA